MIFSCMIKIILLDIRGCIKSVGYNKKVSAMVGDTQRFVDTDRTATEIATWFLQRNAYDRKNNLDVEGISNLKLQKLLYYAYGCFLALYGERLFHDYLLAWQHGPVVAQVYEDYKSNGANSITNIDTTLVEFNQKIIDVLEFVYSEFGKYTAWALRNMTHEETPWKETPRSNVIEDDLIFNYFRENYIEA